MRLEAVAARYAGALFSLAADSQRVDAVGKELDEIQATLGRHPDLARALEAPPIPDAVKKDILAKLFADAASEPILRFLGLLVDKKREGLLGAIVEAYHGLERSARRELAGEVRSAVALSSDAVDQLSRTLSARWGSTVKLTTVVDPDILGGLVVKVGDRLIDASLRRQLDELHERLLT